MERQMKRKNLIFYGIKHDSRTKAEEAVKDVIEGNMEVKLREYDIDNIFTLGKKENSPICVQLTTEIKAWQILKESKKLKGTGLGVARDLPKEMKEVEKKYVEQLKDARKNKQRISWKGNHLTVGGKSIAEMFPQTSVKK
jgi:hypothetical protein